LRQAGHTKGAYERLVSKLTILCRESSDHAYTAADSNAASDLDKQMRS